jgi:2-polyprenyl-3-methyl-5-hydroxy-6-metoxy-1,4-benzoquinol methylase
METETETDAEAETDAAERTRALTEQTRVAWDTIAPFWDERMGEGNQFQRFLVSPATERLLELRPDELVLEIACGNGVMARRMAALGARVVATDFSERLLERARARASDHGERIEYRLVDATDEAQLLVLGEGRFDAVVCNMALMDMAAIEPMLRAVPRLLTPAGRFVFTTMHPCFNTGDITLMVEETDVEGKVITTFSVKVAHYSMPSVKKGLGMLGQPVPQLYFHRPLSMLLGACFAAGLALDGLEEPTFAVASSDPAHLSWSSYTDIPPVLAARLRPRR